MQLYLLIMCANDMRHPCNHYCPDRQNYYRIQQTVAASHPFEKEAAAAAAAATDAQTVRTKGEIQQTLRGGFHLRKLFSCYKQSL